jgi:hypothetical protein
MYGFPLDLVVVQQKQKIELNKPDQAFHQETLEGVKLVMAEGTQDLCIAFSSAQHTRLVPSFLCHPGGQCLANTKASVCYCKDLVYQAGQEVAKKCPVCQEK